MDTIQEIFHYAVADLIASALNCYITINKDAPALAAIEHKYIAWLCREVVG